MSKASEIVAEIAIEIIREQQFTRKTLEDRRGWYKGEYMYHLAERTTSQKIWTKSLTPEILGAIVALGKPLYDAQDNRDDTSLLEVLHGRKLATFMQSGGKMVLVHLAAAVICGKIIEILECDKK